MKEIIYEKNPPIGWLILNRPQKRNALSLRMIQEIKKQVQFIAKDKDVKVVIIRSNSASFCSGHDLKELIGDHDKEYYHNIFSTCTEMMQMITMLPQPVIAMVQGVASAAGCQLVASCSLAIASENAVFTTPGVKIGLFCSTPMVPLCRVIGRRRVLDMLLTGREVSAKEAKEFGLVNKVVSNELLLQETEKWAKHIAQYSSFTVQFGKKVFYNQINLNEKDAYKRSVDAIVTNCNHEDAQEGMSALLEKRKPIWKS